MIYLDSSAILKLVVEERESAALEQWLSERQGMALVSSQLVRTEVVRAARRLDERAVPTAQGLVSQLDLIPIGAALLNQAGQIGSRELRSLDAIHLASAMSIRADLTDVVVYDHRLADAATAAGLVVAKPGAA